MSGIGREADPDEDRRPKKKPRKDEKEAPREKRYRAFVFTWNLPGADNTDDPVGNCIKLGDHMHSVWVKNRHLTRFIYQLERAPSTGTYHFQGFMCTMNSSSFAVIHGYFKDVHAKATPWVKEANQGAAAWDYCQKPDSKVAGPWQHGSKPAQGKRADLDDFVDAVSALAKGERTIGELRTEFVHIDARYNRFFTQRITAARAKRTKKTHVILCGGPPGTGKSHACRQLSRSLFGVDPYPIMLREGHKGSTGQNWFDGMSLHRHVVSRLAHSPTMLC